MPWRVRSGVLEVLLVHRPRYDDWSWPKGKLDPGEDWATAAARETVEETGLEVRLGRPLPGAEYIVLTKVGEPADKVVHYWAACVTGGEGVLENEIDATAWLDVTEAHTRLDYAHDRDQLRAVVRSHTEGTLDTWPLVVVRHAKAVARSDWTDEDPARPLNERGHARAAALVPLLTAYGITRVITSPSARCLDTVLPYAVSAGIEPRMRMSLSEEGYDADPDRAVEGLDRLLRRAEPVAVCSHGPLMSDLLDVLGPRLALDGPDAATMLDAFSSAQDERLAKGEALVCHLSGAGPQARVVAVERHLPA